MSTPNPFQPQQPGSPAIGSPPPIGSDPLAALEQTSDDESALSQQQAGVTKNVISQVENMQPPQPNRGVLSVAPLLIGLAAVGGKSMGLHAQVMLGAMNGMVSGAMKGDQMAFQDSLKKYQLNYQKMMTLYQLQNQYYQEMMNAYKGQADAELKSITLAERLSDDQFNKSWKTASLAQKNQMDSFDRWYKKQSLIEKIRQNDIEDSIRSLELQMKQMQQKKQAQIQAQLNQQAIELGAQDILKGKNPPSLGFGVNAVNARIAMWNRAGEEAAKQPGGAAGAVAGASRFQAMQKELDQVQKTGGMVVAWEHSANLQAQIVLTDSQKLSRSDSPAINKALMFYLTHGVSDPDATKLENAVAVFSAEYAKVMSGQTGGQGVTDLARNEAGKITSAIMSGSTLQQVIAQEQQSMRNRSITFSQLEDAIQKNMATINNASGLPQEGTKGMLNGKPVIFRGGQWVYQ
jgi:hypothetical protein